MMHALLLSVLSLFPSFASEPVVAKPVPAIEMDCLAGVCLLSPLSKSYHSTANVSGTTWDMYVESCNNQVVSVAIMKPYLVYAQTDSSGPIAEVAPTYEIANAWANGMVIQLGLQLQKLGWQQVSVFPINNDGGVVVLYLRNQITGMRKIIFVKDEDSMALALKSVHPDAEAMCAGSLQEGL